MSKPKPAQAVSFAQLKREARTHRPIAFKTVGSGTALVYTDTVNFYTSDGTKLRDWLWKNYQIA